MKYKFKTVLANLLELIELKKEDEARAYIQGILDEMEGKKKKKQTKT